MECAADYYHQDAEAADTTGANEHGATTSKEVSIFGVVKCECGKILTCYVDESNAE
jgi:hypothetical protein